MKWQSRAWLAFALLILLVPSSRLKFPKEYFFVFNGVAPESRLFMLCIAMSREEIKHSFLGKLQHAIKCDE